MLVYTAIWQQDIVISNKNSVSEEDSAGIENLSYLSNEIWDFNFKWPLTSTEINSNQELPKGYTYFLCMGFTNTDHIIN